MRSFASSANSSGNRDGFFGSIDSSRQAQYQARRRPSLVSAFGTERLGRRVVQEAAEHQVAPVAVAARVQDELVPHRVDGARRHRDEALVAAQAGEEELAQPALDEVAVLAAQVRIGLAQLSLQELRNRRLAHRDLALPARPDREDRGAAERPDQQREEDRLRPPPAADRAGDADQPDQRQRQQRVAGVSQQPAAPAVHRSALETDSETARAGGRGRCALPPGSSHHHRLVLEADAEAAVDAFLIARARVITSEPIARPG
jgi:hypothetical protein